MRLDHISYAVSAEQFHSAVTRLGSLLGAPFADGGVHPRYGTRNAVLPLDAGCYVEIVAPLDHPATDPMPFGQAVRRRAQCGGGWLGWVVRVTDLGPFEARLGRTSAQGHRRRPDGTLLQWRQIGLLDLLADPQIPYLIQWCSPEQEHPSAGADGAVGIERLRIAGQRDRVLAWLGTPEVDPLPHVHVTWIDSGDGPRGWHEAGVLAVDFRTPNGTVRID